MKRPLVGLTLAYTVGILAGASLTFSPLLFWSIASVLLVGFVLFRQSRFSVPFLLALVAILGATAYRFAVTRSSPIDIARLIPARDQNISLRGLIVSDPGYRPWEVAGEPHRFHLELQAIKRFNQWEPAVGRVLMSVGTSRSQAPLHYGDQIECSALLRVPRPPGNPGLFDGRAWLARQGIAFTAMIRPMDSCEILAADRGNPVMALSLRWREQFEKALRLGLENEPQLAGVVAGMVIGEISDIPRETYAEFQQTGVLHVFSISGLHVGIVTGVVLVFLKLVRIPRRWCALIAIPLLIIYVFATGTRPCAVRALVMAGVWLVSWLLVRPTDALSVLAAAALGLLLWDPVLIFDGGFILSFSVVLGLILLSPPVEGWLKSCVATDPLLPDELVPPWRQKMKGPLHKTTKLVGGSCASWLALLPLVAFDFHLLAPVTLLANLVAIPLVAFIIPVGMIGTLLYPIWPALTLLFNNANYLLLQIMIGLNRWFSHWPGGHWFVASPSLWLIGTYYALLFLWLNRSIAIRWKSWLTGGVLAMAALILFITQDRAVEVTVLDVPDGAAVFVNAPGLRSKAWLIDGGSDRSGENIILPFLRHRGIDQLDTILLTHGDKAHVGGLTPVVQHLPLRQALIADDPTPAPSVRQWLDLVRSNGTPVSTLRAGDEHILAGPLRLRVLASADNGTALMLEYGANRVLLASDIGRSVERRLLATGSDLRAQIIIKGRHYSEPSGTAELLDAVQPEAVVQIVNSRPGAHSLDPELRDRLRKRSTRVYRTDENGAVTIRLTGTSYEIQTCLTAAARLGNEGYE